MSSNSGRAASLRYALRMDGLVVRPMRPSDEAFVADLGRSAFAEYSREPSAGVLAMARRGLALVALQDGERVGFAIVEAFAHEGAHLLAISVSESARGRGIARALLTASERVARKAGAPSLGLVTADSNLAALDLFLRSGFAQVGRANHYYQRGQDAVRMEKTL